MCSKSNSKQNVESTENIGCTKKKIKKTRGGWQTNKCQDLRLVLVKWIDSGLCDPTWIEASSYEKKPMPVCFTVGWLHKKTKDTTILFSSYSLENDKYKEGNEGTIQIIYNKCILELINVE